MSALSELDGCRYRAYISYSHRDEKWAVWLHKKLEGYRLPRRLVGRKTASGVIPKRIAPVFRDREELPTATDLGETVNKALRDSANLIVICSPSAAASHWVNEEILTFERLGRSDRIFCFIVDGEPNASGMSDLANDECFPIALRFHLNMKGDLSDEPAEPIAADAREGKDGKTDAKLKLIAGIVGVGFDEFKRRDLHRRHYRMAAVTAMALTIMVVTSILAIRATVAEKEALRHRAQAENLVSFMLGDLQERLAPIGRLDVLDAVGDKVVEYFESLDEDDLTPGALGVRSSAMRQIGEVRMAQGRLGSAMAAFQRSLSDAELLVDRDPYNNTAQFALAQANFWIGYVHLEQGEIDQALDRFRMYRDISKAQVEREPQNETWLRELGYAYTNLGTVFYSHGRAQEALEQFQGAQTIAEALLALNPDDSNLLFDVAEATSWVGSALSASGNLDGALGQFRDEVEIKQKLVAESPQNSMWRRGLSLGYRRVGEVLEAQGQVNNALDSFEAGLNINEGLILVDSSNANWKQDAAALQAALGRVQLALQKPQQALVHVENYRQVIKALLAQDNSKVRWQGDLVYSWILTGKTVRATGDLDGAAAALRNAFELATQLLSRRPGDRLATRFLSEIHLLDGQLSALAGNEEDARNMWRKSLVILEPLANETKDYQILNIQAQALLCLGLVEDAKPIIQRLAEIGFADPAYVELRSSRELSTKVVP